MKTYNDNGETFEPLTFRDKLVIASLAISVLFAGLALSAGSAYVVTKLTCPCNGGTEYRASH